MPIPSPDHKDFPIFFFDKHIISFDELLTVDIPFVLRKGSWILCFGKTGSLNVGFLEVFHPRPHHACQCLPDVPQSFFDQLAGVAHLQKNLAEQVRSVLASMHFGNLVCDHSASLEGGMWPAAFVGLDSMSDKQAALLLLSSKNEFGSMCRVWNAWLAFLRIQVTFTAPLKQTRPSAQLLQVRTNQLHGQPQSWVLGDSLVFAGCLCVLPHWSSLCGWSSAQKCESRMAVGSGHDRLLGTWLEGFSHFSAGLGN